MPDQEDVPLSPTLAKVLDAFADAMKADEDIENAAADRLDTLLRSGKTPKPDDISAGLFPPPDDEEESREGDSA